MAKLTTSVLITGGERIAARVAGELLRVRSGGRSEAEFDLKRATGAAETEVALDEEGVELLLGCAEAGAFGPLEAWVLLRKRGLDVPLIVVDAEPDTRRAVEAMKAGAADYLAESELSRLEESIERVLSEAQARRERRQQQEELRKSEALYRVMVENAMDLIAIGDPDNTWRYVNPAIEQLVGYKPEEVIGTKMSDLLHPEDLEGYAGEIIREVESGSLAFGPVEARYRHKDGSYRRVESYLNMLFEDPDVGGGVFISRDVTERRRMEEELAQYKVMVENALDLILIANDDNTWRYANPAVERLLGYEPDEIRGRSIAEIVHPEDIDGEIIAGIMGGSKSFGPLECRYLHKDGSYRRFETYMNNLIDDPSVRGVVGISRDVTERRRMEEEIKGLNEDLERRVEERTEQLRAAMEKAEEAVSMHRLSEERFRSLVQHGSDVITVLEADGTIRYESPAIERVFGYASEELIGENAFSFVHPDERERIAEAFSESSKHRGVAAPVEFRFRHKDGSYRYLEAIGTNLLDVPGVEGIVVNSRDVTERKRSEERLQRTLGVVVALYESSRMLNSTLKTEQIGPRLLEIMRKASSLLAAAVLLEDGRGGARLLYSFGPDAVLAAGGQEAEAARRRALLTGRPVHFRPRLPVAQGPVGEEPLSGLCLPLPARGGSIGVLEAYGPERGPGSLADEETAETLASLASGAASALENARLYEELEERERRLEELVGKLIAAQEEERRRVAYDIHDGLAQVAVAAHQHLEAFTQNHLPECSVAREKIGRISELVELTLTESRQVISDLRPTVLDDFGLAAAVRTQVESLASEGLRVDYEEDLGERRLSPEAETALFRIVQEALANVRKHARATRASVRLNLCEEEVSLRVRDEGRGFDPSSRPSLPDRPGERVGLQSMRERAALLGGELRVNSEPGLGTSVVARIPLALAKEDGEGADGT